MSNASVTTPFTADPTLSWAVDTEFTTEDGLTVVGSLQVGARFAVRCSYYYYDDQSVIHQWTLHVTGEYNPYGVWDTFPLNAVTRLLESMGVNPLRSHLVSGELEQYGRRLAAHLRSKMDAISALATPDDATTLTDLVARP